MRFDVVLALLVSTTWAMPEPLLRGTSDRIGSTFSFVYILTIINHANKVANGKKKDSWYELYKSSYHKDG